MKATLQEARLNAGITRKDAAERIGIQIETLYRYEKGLSAPKLWVAIELLKLYGLKFEDIEWQV